MLSSDHNFIPRRGLSGGHAQTIAGNFLPRTNSLPEGERRRFLVGKHESGANIEVECVCHWQPLARRRPPKVGNSPALIASDDPMTRSVGSAAGAVIEVAGVGSTDSPMTVVIVHGLEGSAESQYVIGTGSKAWAAGMNVVRMNMRNCGNTETLTPTLYHSGLSADVGAVAEELIKEDGLERIALVGFSMGGNLVLKLAGEWGVQAPKQVKAFATVSPAMDLAASADALHSWKNWVYEQRFLRGLRRRYRRKVLLFPDRYDLAHLKRFPSIREFDDKITARYEGFAGAEDYYQRASSSNVLENIRVPTLVIHSNDDPFIRILPATRQKLIGNCSIRWIETTRGGHCAFLAEPNGYDGRWAEKQLIDFILGLEGHPSP